MAVASGGMAALSKLAGIEATFGSVVTATASPPGVGMTFSSLAFSASNE